MYLLGSSLSTFTSYSSWSDLVGSSYSSSIEGVYVGSYSSQTIDIIHLSFTPSDASLSELFVSPSSEGVESSTCGWSDIPCQTVHTAYDHTAIENRGGMTVYGMDALFI